MRVDAKLLSSSLVLTDANKRRYFVRPKGWNKDGIRGALERFATTTYELTDGNGNVLSTIRYDGKKDSIIITKLIDGEKRTFETVHSWMKPYDFNYKGKLYRIYETITGKVVIRDDKGKLVAKGSCGFTSVAFEKCEGEIAEIMNEIAIGYCIKSLVWFMFI